MAGDSITVTMPVSVRPTYYPYRTVQCNGAVAAFEGKPITASGYKHPGFRKAWEDGHRLYHEGVMVVVRGGLAAARSTDREGDADGR